MWTNFNNPFTVAFYNELRKKLLYNPPPHLKSVAALPCEIWTFAPIQLYTIVIQFKSMTNRLFAVNIYRDVMFWIICLCQFYSITACAQSIHHQHAIACFASYTQLCQLMRQWRVVAMLWQACGRRCRNLLCWHDVKWCHRHTVKTVKLK